MKNTMLNLAACAAICATSACISFADCGASQWKKARVAFLGDPMTAADTATATNTYCKMLGDDLELDWESFGADGAQFIDILEQAEKADKRFGGEIDAIVLFAGSGDYGSDVPLGKTYDEGIKETGRNGRWLKLRHRAPSTDAKTFCGALNVVLAELKRRHPRSQIVLMTPPRRGYATFANDAIYPDDSYANGIGVFLSEYAKAIKDAGELWSVPVIDVGGECGICPMERTNPAFYENVKTDQLHLNAIGHYRIAQTVRANLSRIPRLDPARMPMRPALETATWQAAIDAAAAAGGGKVTVTPGVHKVGTIYLKSGVTLELAKGAVLLGSSEAADYPNVDIEFVELREPWQALIVADGQRDVAIVGEGTIDGNGASFPRDSRLGRPRGLIFHKCANVRLEGFTIVEPASWTCYLKECDGVVVRRLKVDAHANGNNDGIDIDSRNVLVEDCFFDSDDDGIVLKSDNPDFAVENVEVRNCTVRSCCSTLKLGTGSHGGFKHVRFQNISCGAARREHIDPKTGNGLISDYRVATWPGATLEKAPISGIVIECVDGAEVDDVVFRDIDISRATVPIFVRGGMRRGRKWGNAVEVGIPLGRGRSMSNILIENVKAKQVSFTANSITGIPELRLKNITLRNVEIEVPGAGEAGRREIGVPVPEKEDAFPESNMFDARMLPAYGFYVRHVDGLTMENVTVKVLGQELREETILDDVTSASRR